MHNSILIHSERFNGGHIYLLYAIGGYNVNHFAASGYFTSYRFSSFTAALAQARSIKKTFLTKPLQEVKPWL